MTNHLLDAENIFLVVLEEVGLVVLFVELQILRLRLPVAKVGSVLVYHNRFELLVNFNV